MWKPRENPNCLQWQRVEVCSFQGGLIPSTYEDLNHGVRNRLHIASYLAVVWPTLMRQRALHLEPLHSDSSASLQICECQAPKLFLIIVTLKL
jgi:hypothetical protein